MSLADEVAVIDDAAKRREFLNLYGTPGFLVIRNVLKALGVNRGCYNRWRKEDPEFARSVRDVQEDLADMVEEMALKKAGIIPSTSEEARGMWRYSDTMVGLLLRVYRNAPESQTFNTFAINIPGISRDSLIGLAAPYQAAPQLSPAVEPPLIGDGEDCPPATA